MHLLMNIFLHFPQSNIFSKVFFTIYKKFPKPPQGIFLWEWCVPFEVLPKNPPFQLNCKIWHGSKSWGTSGKRWKTNFHSECSTGKMGLTFQKVPSSWKFSNEINQKVVPFTSKPEFVEILVNQNGKQPKKG